MDELQGKQCVVTGAASGIGLHTALQLAAAGANVAVVDCRQQGLDAVAPLFEALQGSASFHCCDVTDREALERLATELDRAGAGIDVLVNNAGTAVYRDFAEMDAALFDRVMAVNFTGAVDAARAFLPALLRRRGSQLVNIASIGAFSTAPGYSSYSASKYALRAFSEALSQEHPADQLNVLAVFPGGIRTGLERNSIEVLALGDSNQAAAEERGATSAESAGRQIVRAIQRRKRRLFIGADARLLYLFERLAPGTLNKLVGWWVRRAVEQAEKN